MRISSDCMHCVYVVGDTCSWGCPTWPPGECGRYERREERSRAMPASIQTLPVASHPKVPPATRRRSPGRPAVDVSLPRADRWRAMIRTFEKSTGIMLGTPEEPLPLAFVGDDGGLHDGPLCLPDLGSHWPGRDPKLQSVLDRPELREAISLLDARSEPGYRARLRTWATLQRLRISAQEVLSEWAHNFILPCEVCDAAKLIVDFDLPSPAVPDGRPRESLNAAREAIVRVLDDVRRPDGRRLSVPDLTLLLILTLPEQFLDKGEMALRDPVRKARPRVRRRSKTKPATHVRK